MDVVAVGVRTMKRVRRWGLEVKFGRSGAAYYELGWLGLAERALREAAALEPAHADTWRRLALVLGARRDHAAAADAAAAALALHPAAPAAPLPL